MIKTLGSKVVYKNPWMTVREDDVEFPNGHTGIYGVVEKQDFALIIPFDGTFFYLVKQYRYPVQQDSLEFPQGKHEDEEQTDPKDLARAELQEETGMTAGKLEEIGFLHEALGYSNQGFHIFLATELKKSAQMLEATEAGLSAHKVTKQELEEMIISGQVTDAPTISAYGLAKLKGFV